MKKKEAKRPFRVYTVIGPEWFTLLAAKVRREGKETVLTDAVNLDERGNVLDTWSEVRLSSLPLLVARE